MKAPAFVVSSAVALMLASAVHADGYTDADKCDLLVQDFDWVMMLYSGGPNAEAAKQKRAEAEDLCAKGDPVGGVARLTEAFADINIPMNDYPSANTP